MKTLKEFWAVLVFTLEKKWVFIVCLLAVLFIPYLKNIHETLNNKIEVATFFVTLFLLYKTMKDEWMEDLKLRLTVTFSFEGKKVMQCECFTLAHETDIRNWAQQAGKQMNDLKNLDFDLTLKQDGPKVIFETGAKPYKLYTCEMRLTKVPDKFVNSFEKEYVLWKYNANNELKECFKVAHIDNNKTPCILP